MNIKPKRISKNEESGIYIIKVKLEKNYPYKVSTTTENGKLVLQYFYDIEYMPGQFDEYCEEHWIDVVEDFYSLDYIIFDDFDRGFLNIYAIPLNYLSGPNWVKL